MHQTRCSALLQQQLLSDCTNSAHETMTHYRKLSLLRCLINSKKLNCTMTMDSTQGPHSKSCHCTKLGSLACKWLVFSASHVRSLCSLSPDSHQQHAIALLDCGR